MGLTQVMCSLPLRIQKDLASVDENVSWDAQVIGHEGVLQCRWRSGRHFRWNGKTAPRLTL